MFSIAAWDMKEEKLYLVRDRLGEKPLYFLKDKGNFFFGSETKFIRILLNNLLHFF